MLRAGGPVRYTGAADTDELADALEDGAAVVVSDSNRRRAREIPIFDSIARSSYTLAAGQELRRESQELFDATGAETVAHFPDAVQIESSSYGRPPLPQAYYRPSNAFDGDPRTSWRVAPAFVDEIGQWVRVDLGEPHDVATVDLVAAQTKPSAQSPDPMHVTRATVILSDGTERSVDLVDGRAHVELDGVETDSVEVRIDEVGGTDPRPFGFSEITIDDLDLREEIQLPDDLIRRAGDSPRLRSLLESAPITYQLARLERLDDHAVEPALSRRFRTIGDRTYSLRGTIDATSATGLPVGACGDIGLTVDGRPVLVREQASPLGSALQEDAPASVHFIACDDLELSEGWHTLRTERDPSVRRVWLMTGEQPTDTDAGQRAELVDRGRADFEIVVDADEPTTVISGQSSDEGWDATIDGGDAGPQRSLDGQAAWRVDAGEHRLEAQQRAQLPYQLALGVTALGLILCIVLLVRGRLR
jgi:hypothetical protein